MVNPAPHLYEVRLRGDVAGALVPGGDDGVRQALEVGVAFEDLLKKAQAAPAGADAELRVERQHHQLVHAVPLYLRRRSRVFSGQISNVVVNNSCFLVNYRSTTKLSFNCHVKHA